MMSGMGPGVKRFDFHDSPEWSRVVAKLGKTNRWHRVSGTALPYPVLLRLGRAPDGRLVCTGLIAGALGDGEVSATSLREIPLGEILSDLASLGRIKDPALRWLFSPTGVTDVTRLVARGPRGLPIDHFKRVAAKYREALVRAPKRPVAWLAEQMHAPEPTVRRWLQRCRDMGFIGPSQAGKAGERPTKRRGRKR